MSCLREISAVPLVGGIPGSAGGGAHRSLLKSSHSEVPPGLRWA